MHRLNFNYTSRKIFHPKLLPFGFSFSPFSPNPQFPSFARPLHMAVKTTLVKIYTDQPNLRIKDKLKQAETVQFHLQNICSIVF